jgi:mono/diheme cytochrome c family protein
MTRRNILADADNSRRGLVFLFRLVFVCVPLTMSGCALFNDRGISVEPDPGGFGREYPEEFVAAGQAIAREQCASCHAIDQQQKSRHPGAPPFSTLLQHRDPELLTDNLIAGNRVGHAGMPRFDFNVIAADSLVAYLEAISLDRNERVDVRP